MENKRIKVYLASAFFNQEEIGRMEIVRDILRQKGLDVFVPNEHQNPQFEFGSLEWRKATFKSDVDAIDEADIMVAINCEGNYDDAGTMWEIGRAYTKGIPVILFNNTGKTINLMIADSLHALITSYDELQEYDFEKLEKKPYLDYVW
jgi:nucleoside deoxyribosyltransferase